MANHAPIAPFTDQMKKLMELMDMPKNVYAFTIRGSVDDALKIELTYAPSGDVFDDVWSED